MRAGLLLRIALYVLGIYALQGALSHGVYYLHLGLIGAPDPDPGRLGGPSTRYSLIFGYCFTPLLFALACFGFAGAIERILLGTAGNERIEFSDASTGATLRVGIKLVGLFLVATYLGPLLSTAFEFVAARGGSSRFVNEQITSDFIFNLVGLGFGYFFCAQTNRVLKTLTAIET